MIGVVIVEDETYIRKGMVLTTPWKELGCEIIGEASDGAEGLELVTRLNPDIVITDVNMPNMDGIDMIKGLYEKLDTEFVIISGYDDFNYAHQAIKLGVKDYLLKPIDDDDFYATLKSVIAMVNEKKKRNRHKEILAGNEDVKTELFNEQTYDNHHDGRKKYVTKAVEMIEQHYSENISISDVALALDISESYLSRLFKIYMNYTFVEYLTDYRIKSAIKLLQDHTIKIYEVSERVGYQDPKYFAILFKKKMGVSPMQFKNGLAKSE